ncbi:MAG: cold shock domain-containing protein [Phycisphaerae bacterium]
MATVVGKIKWFNNRKGFGFIVGPENQDIFVHQSDIIADGYRSLADGDTVEYECQPGPKGIKAVSVRRIQASVDQPVCHALSEILSPPTPSAKKPE